jgi:hypothetical protein
MFLAELESGTDGWVVGDPARHVMVETQRRLVVAIFCCQGSRQGAPAASQALKLINRDTGSTWRCILRKVVMVAFLPACRRKDDEAMTLMTLGTYFFR